jgi:hypothetical protein
VIQRASLNHNWVHANKCVSSTLHQCLMQWIRDLVEIVGANEVVCVTMAESQVDVQGGQMGCLTGRDLFEYDYVSVGKDGFVPISVKLMTSVTTFE